MIRKTIMVMLTLGAVATPQMSTVDAIRFCYAGRSRLGPTNNLGEKSCIRIAC